MVKALIARRPIILLGLFVSLSTATSQSMAADFASPGPFAIGFQLGAVPDENGTHKLNTAIWYPAAGPIPDPATVSANVRALGLKDAPPATTVPFPLVILVHGLYGTGLAYGVLGKHLASYGFVVLAGDYDPTSEDVSDPDLSPEDQVAIHLLRERPADVIREIAYADQLTAPGGKLAGVIDTSRIGVWGHSTGGSTALQAAGAQIDFKALDAWCSDKDEDPFAAETCQFVGHERPVATLYGATDAFSAPLPPLWDPRVSALALAAPGGELHAFGDVGIASVKVPTLIMVSSTDAVVHPEYNAFWAFDGISSASKTLAVFDGGSHMMFIEGGHDGPRLDELNALTVAFFLDILKDDQVGHAALRPGTVSFPGLTYRTTSR
jgi:predicted dienelactone hydrolase